MGSRQHLEEGYKEVYPQSKDEKESNVSLKGYMFISQIVAIEGADNHPRLVAQNTAPIPYSGLMAWDMMSKSLVSSHALDVLRLASERERGVLHDRKSEKEIDGTGVADILTELSVLLRNNEVKAVSLSRVDLDGQTHVVLDVKRKS